MAAEGPVPTVLVLVPEWVIGDGYPSIAIGNTVALQLSSPDPAMQSGVDCLMADRSDAGLEPAEIFVVEPTDPRPTVELRGTVVSIRALRWSDPTERPLRLEASPHVRGARVDTAVDDYLVEVTGLRSAR